jgi:two-component system, NtrC family, response regulator
VLILDDERDLHPLYQHIVTLAGGEPVMATTCAEAEALLGSLAFGCAILDKNLPDGNGVELAGKIRTSHRDLAVLIVTGYASIDSVENAVTLGIFDYIVKPFDVGQLRQSVEAALAWRKSRAP